MEFKTLTSVIALTIFMGSPAQAMKTPESTLEIKSPTVKQHVVGMEALPADGTFGGSVPQAGASETATLPAVVNEGEDGQTSPIPPVSENKNEETSKASPATTTTTTTAEEGKADSSTASQGYGAWIINKLSLGYLYPSPTEPKPASLVVLNQPFTEKTDESTSPSVSEPVKQEEATQTQPPVVLVSDSTVTAPATDSQQPASDPEMTQDDWMTQSSLDPKAVKIMWEALNEPTEENTIKAKEAQKEMKKKALERKMNKIVPAPAPALSSQDTARALTLWERLFGSKKK